MQSRSDCDYEKIYLLVHPNSKSLTESDTHETKKTVLNEIAIKVPVCTNIWDKSVHFLLGLGYILSSLHLT